MTSPADRAGAFLTIDLDAVIANWSFVKSRLKPGCRAAAVVKADAYGLGARRVAPALLAAGCRRFVVATLEEGLTLRPLLADAEIHVLNGPIAGTEADFLEAGLTPVLNSTEQAEAWAALARRTGRRLEAVFHIDTGMSRLGLTFEEARSLVPLAARDLSLRLVMSHLACADRPADPMNESQLAKFRKAWALFPGIEGSLSASSGIFLGHAWQADWVRPGAALYGIQPNNQTAQPLHPVVQLSAKILQLREIDAGDTVGYGATHRATGRARLATVAAGYADGLLRMLGNRGWAYLEGIRVPLVGRVSMDLAIFDISAVPADRVKTGDLVELIGPHISIDAVGEAAGTIGYEILTMLGSRYHRHYLGGPLT